MTVPVDVRDLLDQPGVSRAVHVEEPVVGLTTALAFVPEDEPVGADLLLESVVEGVLVSGCLTGTRVESCARCLDPVERRFQVDVRELFSSNSEGDAYRLDEGTVDLEPMIRDSVVLSMPFSPLCRPDCLGLCERCGANRNEGGCGCPAQIPDVRWSTLATLELGLPDITDDN